MSYPPYGGGYPQAPGGYPGGPGYGQPPGMGGMPTPESAAAAAYGGAPGGLPYGAQPPAPAGNIGFNTGPMPGGPGMPQPGPGYPAGMPGGNPAPYAAQPGYPSQPGYPAAPAPGPGYPQAAPPGGYGGAPVPYQAQGSAPPPQQPGYGAPGSYGAPPAGGYGTPPNPGYGAPPAHQAYGAPPASGHGYGAPTGPAYGAPSSQTPAYGAPPANAPAQGQYGGYGSGQYGGAPSNVPGPAKYKLHEEGTLKPRANFNAEQDVQVLRKAMKGIGTDEKAIIEVLGHRTCEQRQNIKMMYKTCFGRDLVKDLKDDLGGRFENACVALMMRSDEFDAYELRRAMRGAGTDEAALIEILCTRSNAQIHAINATYKQMYGKVLEKDIMSETSGHFRKLLVSMTVGGRQEGQQVDMNKARADAQRLYQAGEKRWGTDENTFNMILASQSYEQLRAVFDEYTQVSKHDIEQAIRNEMSGDVQNGMLTLVRMIRSKHGYFAERLYHSMKGMGTDDRTLVRIIVSRCEVDMKQIKAEFQRRYGQSLEAFVRDDVSGDYRKMMLALISG